MSRQENATDPFPAAPTARLFFTGLAGALL
jgi:hypothetical protein